MRYYGLKCRKQRTLIHLCVVVSAAVVLLLFYTSGLFAMQTLITHIQLEDSFIETALSVGNIPLDSLPISNMRKAILHLTENYKEDDQCKSCNKVQQKLSERTITANILDKIGPCNFLIFGVGFDSIMWTAMNPGRTVFLEDNELWVEKVRKVAPFLEIHTVNYPVRKKDFPQSLERVKKQKSCSPFSSTEGCFLLLNLPKNLLDTSWDVIMIDAPNSGGENSPTRQMSIFTAAILARRNHNGAHILVHDVHREIEKVFSDKFLCPENRVEALERSARLFSGSRLAIWHYHIQYSKAREFCLDNQLKLGSI